MSGLATLHFADGVDEVIVARAWPWLRPMWDEYGEPFELTIRVNFDPQTVTFVALYPDSVRNLATISFEDLGIRATMTVEVVDE